MIVFCCKITKTMFLQDNVFLVAPDAIRAYSLGEPQRVSPLNRLVFFAGKELDPTKKQSFVPDSLQ